MSTPFQWNPFTNNLDHTSLGGGGGGDVTIITDNGAVNGSTIPVKGKTYRTTAKVVETAVQTGDVYIANNAFDTPYVVDQSPLFGQKGTFTTLQEALDAIALDNSASSSEAAIIRMRPGTYVYSDPIVLPAGKAIIIKGDVGCGQFGTPVNTYDVYLKANLVTGTGISKLNLYNLFIIPNSGFAIDAVLNSIVLIDNCTIGEIYTDNATYISASNSILADTITLNATSLELFNCTAGATTIILNAPGSQAKLKYCSAFQINQSSASTVAEMFFCTDCILTGGASDITASAVVDYSTLESQIILDPPTQLYVSNITEADSNSLGNDYFFSNSTDVKQKRFTKGNVFISKIINDDFTIDRFNNFVGVKANVAPVAITINDNVLTGGMPNQTWVIADLEGTASTNPITITPETGLINNKPAYVINRNFGSCQLYFDGINFTVISNNDDTLSNEVPIGALQYFPNANGDSYLGNVWLKCNGQIVDQTTYLDLFNRMGLINDGGINWTVQTSGTSSTISSGAFGNSKYVIAGQAGMVRTSTDAVTWTTATRGVTTTISSMIYAGSQFVYGTFSGAIATSTDGVTWQTKNPYLGTVGSGLNSNALGPFMAYGNSVFVGANTVNGTLMSSTDGITWTTRDSGTTSTVAGLIFGGGKFVFASYGGTIKTSADGITWVAQTSGTTSSFITVSYANSLYLISAVGALLSSTDAITWSSHNPGFGSVNTGPVAFGAGVYTVWNNNTTVATSTDLTTFNNQTWGGTGPAVCALHNGTIFVSTSAGGGIRTSTDGVTWTSRTSNTASTILSLVYSGSLHVYGTTGGGMGTSTDGITWVARTSGTVSAITALAYDGALWHAGGSGFTLTSTDAVTWTTNTGYSGTTSSILSLAYGLSTYVYGAAGGRVATSTDAITWVAQTSGTTSDILALNFGTEFIFAGAAGMLSSSTDGVTWNSQTSGTASTINALTYGNSLYILGTNLGGLSSSTDAVTWTSHTSDTSSSIFGLAYSSNNYVHVGNSLAGKSVNGVDWIATQTTGNAVKNFVYAGSGVFVAGGASGQLYTSPVTYLYDPIADFQIPNDAQLGITNEVITNFQRSLYIKAL